MKHQARLSGIFILAILGALALVAVACGGDNGDANGDNGQPEAPTEAANQTPAAEPEDRGSASGSITVYSGRAEALIGPIIEQFEQETGIDVRVRYGGTPELAATLLEEGSNSPADLYIGQDAGSLGLLAAEGLFLPLPEDILGLVPAQYRADDGDWVGLSGRARVVVYNTDAIDPDTLPDSIFDYTDPQWSGRIGWAPTNASFQSFVTGMRVVHGEDATREWLEDIAANGAREYPNNTSIVEAVAAGEVEVGFANHYYLFRFLAERGEGFGARNFYFDNGDIGGLMNVAGAGVLTTTRNEPAAQRFIEYMLQQDAQDYFAQETFEFPLAPNVNVSFDVPPLAELEPVRIDLTDLGDLRGTIELLQSTGVLP